MKYTRGRPAPNHGPWLTPQTAIALGEVWYQLSTKFPTIAQLLLEGNDKKQIAAKLRWDVRSLNVVLKPYLRDRRDIIRDAKDTAHRLYRSA